MKWPMGASDPYEMIWRFVKRNRLWALPVIITSCALAFEMIDPSLLGIEFKMFRYVGF